MNSHPALPRKRGREMERMWLLLGASLVLGGCSPAASRPAPAAMHSPSASATPAGGESPIALTATATPLSSPAARGRWSGVETPAGPPSRGDAQMVMLLTDGRVLIATASLGPQAVSDTHVSLAATLGASWRRAPHMHTSRLGFGAPRLPGGKVVVPGGV